MNTTITESSKEVYSKSVSYLSLFEKEINKVRKEFYSFTDSLNNPINEILKNHFKERLNRLENVPMLGEYSVLVFGELFSISKKIIQENLLPWFLLYEYSLLLDDLLDKKRLNWELELLASQIVLDKSLSEYLKVIGNNELAFKTFEKFRRQSVDSMIYEILWSKNRLVNSTDISVNIQGQKASLLKFCITSLITRKDNRLLSIDEEKSLNDLCAGIQLLDDLTDIFEDHQEGRMNIVLQETYKWIYKNSQMKTFNEIDYNHLTIGLIYSGNLNITLDIASDLISRAIDLNWVNKKSHAYSFLKHLIIDCKTSSEKFDRLLENSNLNSLMITTTFNSSNVAKSISESHELETLWKKINEYLKFIPKASN